MVYFFIYTYGTQFELATFQTFNSHMRLTATTLGQCRSRALNISDLLSNDFFSWGSTQHGLRPKFFVQHHRRWSISYPRTPKSKEIRKSTELTSTVPANHLLQLLWPLIREISLYICEEQLVDTRVRVTSSVTLDNLHTISKPEFFHWWKRGKNDGIL